MTGMDERTVLEQRVTTLTSLLDGTGNFLGPAGTTLGARLRDTWTTERRLLQRILVESTGRDVRTTLALWRDRTTAFIDRSTDTRPAWTDRDGTRWDAVEVVELLDQTVERLDSWLNADDPLEDDEGLSVEAGD
jgi:hypothetical protein